MATLKIVWTSQGIFPEGFVPPTRFWTEKGNRSYHGPKKLDNGALECLVYDCIQNREYVETAKTWNITQEDVVVKKVIKPTPKLHKEPKSRSQMQSEMDAAQYNYGDGGVMSDARMKEEYRKSAPQRSKRAKKKAEVAKKIRDGEIADQQTILARKKRKVKA